MRRTERPERKEEMKQKTETRKRAGRRRYLMAALAAVTLLGTGVPSLQAQAAESHSSTAFNAETAAWYEQASEKLKTIAAQRDIMALVYLSDEYPIRKTPEENGEVVLEVLSGQLVNIQDVYVDQKENGSLSCWYQVSLLYQNESYTGYVPREYLAVSDERFLQWEADYGMDWTEQVRLADANAGIYNDVEQFPESYKAGLRSLKQAHPNWTFAKLNTTLDWNTVISNELTGDRSLVYKTAPDYAKAGLYDSGNWYYATREGLEEYMDPRNALTENRIFQFEQLTYNEAYHTEEAVEAFLNNTFMKSEEPATGTELTYAQIFWAVGAEQQVSPFHLAARVYQEQGAGNSPLISGNYAGYEGYYNYFNVGATGQSNTEVIRNGLTYAKNKGWDSAYTSIRGGTQVIAANYISKGQHTLYLQKFNVNPNATHALYTHQYMQNIMAPTSEAKSMKQLYEGADSLDNTFVFLIPVYENMSEADGLHQAADGNWYYYADGQVDTGRTGLVYDQTVGWWYVENGKINFNYNGLVPYADAWWCVAGGKVVFDYTGLWSDPNVGWWYVENGTINFNYNGLIPYADAWWCVAGGKVMFDYTGLWSDPNVGWWYVENGAINFNYNGLIPYADAWWCVAGGQVIFHYTGLWSDPSVGWWYVENGVINFNYNGLIPNGEVWWCVAGGKVMFDYTGLWSDPNVGWWYVENGAINFNYNGLIPNGEVWWCVAGGQVMFDYTGLWNDPNVGWWYVENGAINFGYTGMVEYDGNWWNVVNGAVVFS